MALEFRTINDPTNGNDIELLTDQDQNNLYYKEVRAKGVLEAGKNSQGYYWASWAANFKPDNQVVSNDGYMSIEEALSELEAQLDGYYFQELVRKMRAAQQNYCADTTSSFALKQVQELEREVDRHLASLNEQDWGFFEVSP